MNKSRTWIIRALMVAIAASISLLAFASEEEKGTPERYRAVAVTSTISRMNPATQLTILVDRYTTDAELREYATLLKAEGLDPLKRAMEKVNVGRISTPGAVGTAVAMARLHQTDKGRAVRLITARPFSAVQLRHGDGNLYPFSMMELYPEEGEGILFGTLKPYFDETGRLSIKVAGTEPLKLTNVEQVK